MESADILHADEIRLSDSSRLMKKPLNLSSRAKRGICFSLFFNKEQQKPRCARHDRRPFSTVCYLAFRWRERRRGTRLDHTQNEGISKHVIENEGCPKISTGISKHLI
jgi:hypothetical protein